MGHVGYAYPIKEIPWLPLSLTSTTLPTSVINSLADGKHAAMSSAQRQVVLTAGLDLIAVFGCLDKDLEEARRLEARLNAAGASVQER